MALSLSAVAASCEPLNSETSIRNNRDCVELNVGGDDDVEGGEIHDIIVQGALGPSVSNGKEGKGLKVKSGGHALIYPLATRTLHIGFICGSSNVEEEGSHPFLVMHLVMNLGLRTRDVFVLNVQLQRHPTRCTRQGCAKGLPRAGGLTRQHWLPIILLTPMFARRVFCLKILRFRSIFLRQCRLTSLQRALRQYSLNTSRSGGKSMIKSNQSSIPELWTGSARERVERPEPTTILL